MAFETGAATGPADLFSKLKSFLTTNADLVTGSQAWVEAWDTSGVTSPDNSTDCVLRGPGLAGTEEIYVGARLVDNVSSDQHWIEFCGLTGVNASALRYWEHNDPSGIVRVFLNNGPMTYWFVANGRRFIVVVKISTVYESAYCGLLLPYGLPQEYPYPLFIGGSASVARDFDSRVPKTWRDNVDHHTFFLDPSAPSSLDEESSAFVRGPAGDWKTLSNRNANKDGAVGPTRTGSGVSEMMRDAVQNGFDPYTLAGATIDAYGGGRVLTPVPVYLRAGERETLGVLHGVHRVPGQVSAAEDVVTIASVDHLTVPNVFRTDVHDYMTVELS